MNNFKDNSDTIKRQLEDGIISFLTEAAGEIASQASRNSRVDTGATKSSYMYFVDSSSKSVAVGSQLENALWEEFGTGEYAEKGDGRKGGWFYVDSKGDGHFTHGKTPNRPMRNAYDASKTKILKQMTKYIKNSVKG